MAVSVIMPALEMAQESGKLLAWRKKEGERVTKGEPLLEVETDKAVVEIESPGDGILAGISAREGAVIPVGQTIAWLVEPGEAIPVSAAPAQTGRRTESAAARAAVDATGQAAASVRPSEIRISPKARRLAGERGVDVSRLRGSGPGGEILAEDVLAAAALAGGAAAGVAAAATPVPVATPNPSTSLEKLGAVGRLMAERTTQSWTSAPHFFVTREVDAGALVATLGQWGPQVEKARGVKPTLNDVLIALVARVLLKHPRVNASWTADGIRHNADVHMGVAMAVNEGVVAAVVQNAHRIDLGEIAVKRRELTERARAGRLQPADITGATFTISNLGMYGVDAFTAIIVPPQAGILAVGRIADRVVPVNGQPGIRPMMNVTLSSDHRVVDGARAALFLNDVVEAIRDPKKWL
jgi:pyruvate dehydrogenase E2 component (dihydrolipoyllysine-residue acetyltransferase)